MKAMLPDGQRSVRLGEVAEPTPAPGDALVAVEAFSVNRGETFLLDEPPSGWRPGKDIAGTVLVPAADGSGPSAGTRIVGHLPESGWAERVAVPASALAALPARIPVPTAAALPLAGLTALRLLRAAGPLIGRRLLITGASGGVGHYLVELAVASGADVTAVSATVERGRRLRELGAQTVTDVTDAQGWFDVAMESVGGDSMAEVRRRVHPGGLIVWFGQASREPVTLNFFDWVQGAAGARMTQFHYLDSVWGADADLTTLVRLVADGRLHPEIGIVLPWDQTPRVVDDIRARRVRGNAVLEVK